MLAAFALRRSNLTLFVTSLIFLIGFDVRAILFASTPERLSGFSAKIHSLSETTYDFVVFDLIVFKLILAAALLLIPPASRAHTPDRLSNYSNLGRALIPSICAIGFALSWIGFFAILSSIFGSIDHAVDILQRRALIFGSDVFFARTLNYVAGAFAILFCAMARKNLVNNANLWLAIAIIAIHSSLIFLTGSRGAAIIHLAAGLYALGIIDSKKMLTFKNLVTGLFGSLLAYFALLAGLSLRISAQTQESLASVFERTWAAGPDIVFGSFSFFELYAGAKHFAHVTGHTLGENFIALIYRPIPRSMWPEKPDLLGIEIREFYYGDRISGAPPTFVGEFYVAFGVFGVIIAAAIYACLVSAVERARNRENVYLKACGALMAFMLPVEFMKSGLEIGLFIFMYFAAVWIGTSLLIRALSTQHLDGARYQRF